MTIKTLMEKDTLNSSKQIQHTCSLRNSSFYAYVICIIFFSLKTDAKFSDILLNQGSRHRTTNFPNSESRIFTMKFLFWPFWWFWEQILRLLWDLERIRKGCVISIYKLQNVSPYCLIKQVNKILGIRNSEIWLFDDVSKIFLTNF